MPCFRRRRRTIPQPAAKQSTNPQAPKQPVKPKATASKSCPAGSDLKSQELVSPDGAGNPRPYQRDILRRDSGIFLECEVRNPLQV